MHVVQYRRDDQQERVEAARRLLFPSLLLPQCLYPRKHQVVRAKDGS
jgi:hypothetical protein